MPKKEKFFFPKIQKFISFEQKKTPTQKFQDLLKSIRGTLEKNLSEKFDGGHRLLQFWKFQNFPKKRIFEKFFQKNFFLVPLSILFKT